MVIDCTFPVLYVSVASRSWCAMVVFMYVAEPQVLERKCRAVRAAAASAVDNGVDPDEVRRLVEAGIEDALRLQRPRLASQLREDAGPGAVEALARAVGL